MTKSCGLHKAVVAMLCCLGWLSTSYGQTIFDFDWDTSFPSYGYSYGYSGYGDATCGINTDSSDQVSSTYDVSSPPAAVATLDLSSWVIPPDACYDYAGWGLGIGYLPTADRIKLDSGDLSNYTMTVDAWVAGILGLELQTQLQIIFQAPDVDGNLLDYRIGIRNGDFVPEPYLTETPQTLSYNLGDLEFWDGSYDFSMEYAQVENIQLIVQPQGNSGALGLDDDNIVMVDNFQFTGPFFTLPSGDFNDDGVYDCDDVDALVAEMVAATNDTAFDLTGDGLVDSLDLDSWLGEAGAANLVSGNPYLYGDATLDGAVDVSDFNEWNSNKFTSNAGWCGGDFNADGVVDVSDFNEWNENKFQSADNVTTVPEPAALGLLGWILATAIGMHRRR